MFAILHIAKPASFNSVRDTPHISSVYCYKLVS
jgi:hypothetical protein